MPSSRRAGASSASGYTNESAPGALDTGARTSTAWLDTNTALWEGGPFATVAGNDPREHLERALDNMAADATGRGGLFAGRFRVTKERRSGAQALVAFARGGDDGFFQHAIKYDAVLSGCDATLYNYTSIENEQYQLCHPHKVHKGCASSLRCWLRTSLAAPPNAL
jgi:hypothetical protein